jgi:hypothetical protein
MAQNQSEFCSDLLEQIYPEDNLQGSVKVPDAGHLQSYEYTIRE